MPILSTEPHLIGKLSPKKPSLVGTLTHINVLHGTLVKNAYDPIDYTGEYEVISKVNEDETLDTAKKYLRNNIVVKAIPYAEVSNESGGRTVTIGG